MLVTIATFLIEYNLCAESQYKIGKLKIISVSTGVILMYIVEPKVQDVECIQRSKEGFATGLQEQLEDKLSVIDILAEDLKVSLKIIFR